MVRREFPHLEMKGNHDPPHVDAEAVLFAQPGLDFAVELDLQTDDLHLGVSRFWFEWFPRAALRGILSGEYRIRESFVFHSFVAARLQRPDGAGWKAVATHANLRAFLPLPRSHRIVRNGAAILGAKRVLP